MNKKDFLNNYRGMLNPEIAFEEAVAAAENKRRFRCATANLWANKKMEREANNRVKNRY